MTEDTPSSGVRSETAATDRRDAQTPTRRRRWLVAVVLLVIVAAGIAGAAYELREQRLVEQRLTRMADEQQHLRDGITRLQDRLMPRDEIRRTLDDMATQMAALTERQQAIEAQLGPIRRLLEGGRSAWLKAETAYLLQVANQVLQLRRDQKAAIQALQAADKNLALLGEPRLLPVRKAIARELAALRAVPDADPEGLALRLSSLAEQVESWPLSGPRPGETTAAANGNAEGGLERTWNSLLQVASQLVVIRRHHEPIAPLLAPDEAKLLRLHALIELETARMAALDRDPSLYRQQIDRAIEVIQKYYDADSTAVAAALSQLRELKQATLAPTLPDISESLRLLRTLNPPEVS